MKKIIIAVGVVAIILVMVLLNINKQMQTDEGSNVSFGQKAIDVEAKVIGMDNITSSILITGSVEANTVSTITLETPVKIKSIDVEKGQDVHIGDQLFTVDLSDLEEELAGLELNMEIASLNLKKLQSMDTTTDTTSVKVAYEMAKISLASAQSYYDRQVESLDQNTILYEAGVISKSEYEAAMLGVDEAQNQLDNANLSLTRSQADYNSVLESSSMQTEQSEIDETIQLKNMESIQRSIDNLKDRIQEIEQQTKAQIKGTITQINLEEGDQATSMAPIMVITDLSDLMVSASIREFDIKDIEENQKVLVTGEGISDEEEVRGYVSYISPIAEEAIVNGRQTTAIAVEITIDEGLDALRPGYSVDCDITTFELNDVVIVNYDMLRKDDDLDYVFVVKDEHAEKRIVELGITSDFDAQIISGLEEGEIVIKSPSLAIKDGSKVAITNDPEEE